MSKQFKITPLTVLKLDHRPVAEVGVPGHAGVRELPPPPSGTSGRRAGNPALAFPDAALHRHRAWRQPGLCLQADVLSGLLWGVAFNPTRLLLKAKGKGSGRRKRTWCPGLAGTVVLG